MERDDSCDDGGDGGDGGDGWNDSGDLGGSQVSFDPSSGAAYAEAYLSYDGVGEMADSSGSMFSAQASDDVVGNFLQGALNIFGLFPEVGGFANGANAIISLARGNKEAALYASAGVASFLGVPGGSALVKIEEAAEAVKAAESLSDGAELLQQTESATAVGSFRESAGDVKTAARSSQIDRAAFRSEREAYWKSEAESNNGKYNAEDLVKMRMGRAPTGPDGYPMELHHIDGTPEGGVTPMSRSDHRLGENYKLNHP